MSHTNKNTEETSQYTHKPTSEHEPFKYHFDISPFENIATIENNEVDNTPKETSQSSTPNPQHPQLDHSTPPPAQNINQQTTQQHPPMPLTDDEIEKYAHKSKSDEAVRWLALWCIRQLEIFEQELNKTPPHPNP